MKILVTGGLGFIGHHVVQQLERLDHTVVVTDTRDTYGLLDAQQTQALMQQRRSGLVTDRVYGIDISDRDSMDWLFRTHQFDRVIHLASFPQQRVVNQNPAQAANVMIGGLLNLLTLADLYHCEKFCYVSSSMVYGNCEGPVNEQAPCTPQGSYAIMKLAGEQLTTDFGVNHDINTVILRPSAVYGPGDMENRVVSRFLMAAQRNQTLQVRGANELLDFTYVSETAQGIVSATLSQCSGTYNISRGRSRSLLDAAQLAQTLVGAGHIQVVEPEQGYPHRQALVIDAARHAFGFDPVIDIETGFGLYWDWIQSQ